MPPTSTTQMTTWEAVGSVVGIVSCLTCGAAILFDPRDKVRTIDIHTRWHEQRGDTVLREKTSD